MILKMFKFNKGTHLTILATFAIVFIVIYLYFTITDLRKLQGEVTRLRTKVSALEESAATSSQVDSCPVQKPPTLVETVPTAPIVTAAATTTTSPEDNESVLTEDIKKLLDDADDEQENEEHSGVPLPPPPPETTTPEPEEQEQTPVVEQEPSESEVLTTTKTTTRSRKVKATK